MSCGPLSGGPLLYSPPAGIAEGGYPVPAVEDISGGIVMSGLTNRALTFSFHG